MSAPAITKRILFVDNDPAFLNMIEKVFRAWNKGEWEFLRASDAGKALAILEQQIVDLIVIELELPGLDGLQFLNVLQKRFANFPKAILTAHPTAANKTASLNSGAVVYLEKPSTMEQMEVTYQALNELAKWRPAVGFVGMMWCASLHEVLQVECLNQSSAVMEIHSGAARGKVFIKDGMILHVQADHHKGKMALAYLLTLKAGEFYLKPFVDPPEVTIEGSWEGLLMDAAQTRDEEGTAFFRKPARKQSDIESWETTGVPPAPPSSRANETSISSGTTDSLDNLTAPKTEELLLASATGEVFFAWQCPDPETRLHFLDMLQQKTKDLAKSLGAFDRLEIKGDQVRTIARVKADNKMFTRIYRASEVAPVTTLKTE